MNETHKIFLDLVSSYLLNEKKEFSTKFDTQMVQNLETFSSQNLCLPIICEAFVKNNIDIPEKWRSVSSFVVLDSFRKLTIESEVLSIFEKSGIRACILKGSTAAINYTNPLSRSLGDIDILVDDYNYKKASMLFVSQEEFENNKHDFHIGFNYKNVRIEIHKYITDDYIDRKEIRSAFDGALDNIAIKTYENYKIPALSDSHQAVSLLSHMTRHIRDNEFVFRMFLDWVCFVKKTPQNVWTQDVYPTLKLAGFHFFADALNKTAAIYLKLDLSDKVCSAVNDEVCSLIIEEFLGGNRHSVSEPTNINLAAIMAKRRGQFKNKIGAFFDAINFIARDKYATARHKLILPFFWVYIPVKYMLNVILGKRKPLDFKAIEAVSERKTKIFDATQIRL